MHFNFNTNKAEEREEKSFASENSAKDDSIKNLTMTTLSIDKNKFGISEGSIKLVINNTDECGRFVPAAELITWAMNKGILSSKGAYLSISPEYMEKYSSESLELTKNWRFKEIAASPEFMLALEGMVVDYYRTTSKSVDHLYKTKEAFVKKFGYKEVIPDEYFDLLPKLDF